MTEARSLKRAGTLFVVGIGQFVVFLVLAEVYYPGYDVSANTISDLGATCSAGACKFVRPSSEIFDASIVVLGLLLLPGAYCLWKGSGSKGLPFFIALAGIGSLGVGILNESFGGLHDLVSGLTFISAGIQALLVYKVAKPPFSYFLALAGVMTLVATILYATDTYLGLGQGGMERMVIWPALTGGLALGGYLMGIGDGGAT